jgi:microsomal dipeptidase-like Zn-dependent dipeptidase
VRIAQLTYNARNLIGGACYDATDEGLTPYGREVIAEMNRVGMLVDLSHVGDRTSREAVEASEQPVAITHANPRSFVDVPRNKPDDVIRAVTDRGGMIGVCLYPVVAGGADAPLADFTAMVLRLIDDVGIDHVGIGSDCTRGWGRDYLLYLRAGRREPLPGEELPAWPAWPAWFAGPEDFPVLGESLADAGLSRTEIEQVLGGNWRRLLGEVIG